MKRHACFVVLIAVISPALAGPFELGDANHGKSLVDRHCVSCHVSRFGGDGSGVYTRPDHKIRSAEDLVAQIGRCNAGAHAGLSAEDQRDVGAYLDQAFYKFK